MDALEELVGLFLRGKEGDLIAAAQHEVAVGDDDVPRPLDGADEDIALEPGGDLMDGRAVQLLLVGQGELDQPDAAPRKGIDLACAGEPQQVGNFPRRRHLRVDDGRDADLLLDEVQLVAVRRVAHTGDGVAVARLLREHAAQQVQLVGAGDRDEHVGFFDSGFGQGGDGRTVAYDAHHVIRLAQVLHAGLVRVDDRYVVVLLAELPCQRCADLAAAHQNDLHSRKFLSFSSPVGSVLPNENTDLV